jgi:hypothetical protein
MGSRFLHLPQTTVLPEDSNGKLFVAPHSRQLTLILSATVFDLLSRRGQSYTFDNWLLLETFHFVPFLIF